MASNGSRGKSAAVLKPERVSVVAMKRFEHSIDKDTFEMFLEDACEEKFDTFLALMRDPAYAKKPLAQLAKMCHLTLSELQSLYTDGMRQLALIKMSNQLPDIMTDVAEDARTKMESCPRCDGRKVLEDKRPCPMCKGAGEVRRIGDKHARDLVFESAKLTGQKQPLVAIQQNFVGEERMENMLKKTRTIVLENKNGDA